LTNSYTDNFVQSENVKAFDNGTTTTFYVPGNGITDGGRMYLSTGALNGVPDLATYPDIYDKIELGWNDSGTAGWNTTSVDFFGLPIQMKQGNLTLGFKDGTTREHVISELKNNMNKEPELYDSRFFFESDTTILRVFSPQHFYTSLPNKWEPMITKGLDALVTDNETNGTGVYFNFNYGGTVFTNIKKLSADSISVNENGKVQVISGITTGNAVSGQIQPVGDQFAGLLAATINRGVLANPAHWGQSGMPNNGYPQYYYQGPVGEYLYNTYAKSLLDFAIDAKMYATSYDDYWHMDSSIQVGAANNEPVTVKILPLK